MSNLHTEHFEETRRESQVERIADYVENTFPSIRPTPEDKARCATVSLTRFWDPAFGPQARRLDPALEQELVGFRDDIIARMSEAILKCPAPTTDADLRKLEYYIREFTASVEEALTPVDTSEWEELGRASHEIFKEVEGYYLDTHVELEGLDDDERDAMILSKFNLAYDNWIDACNEWTTLTVAQSQLDAAKGKLIRQIDMIYFLK